MRMTRRLAMVIAVVCGALAALLTFVYLSSLQQKTQQAASDEQLAQADLQSDIRRKDIKVGAQMQQSAQKHDQNMRQKMQDMALKDAVTAADIRLKRLEAMANQTRGESE